MDCVEKKENVLVAIGECIDIGGKQYQIERVEPVFPRMNLYVAGPMRGIPYFNFPLFNQVTAQLRVRGHTVFNPAERDQERHGGVDITNATGSEEQAVKEHGFDLRTALREDLEWICRHADGIVLLPGWSRSTGATAEHAVAVALGLQIFVPEQLIP